MKKVYSLIILFTYFSLSFVNAQEVVYNKWSAGLNVGGHYGATPSIIRFKADKITHYGANVRYMMNNRFGMTLDGGYDVFKSNIGPQNVKNHYTRMTLQGVGNLGDIFRFDTWTKRIGLLAHAGFGGSIMVNDRKLRESYNLKRRRDLMLTAILGVSPQVKLNEHISLNMDISYITHVKQHATYDNQTSPRPVAFKNTLMNWSIGATFYLGKNSRHADWTPTIYGSDAVPTNNYEIRIKELEKKIEEDIITEEVK